MKKTATAIISAATLLVGIGIGSAAAGSTEAKVVTREVKSEPIVKTKTVTETVVPDSCLTALDRADDLIDLATEGFGYSADAMGAAAIFDADGIDEATEKMGDLTPRIQAIGEKYVASRVSCQMEAE